MVALKYGGGVEPEVAAGCTYIVGTGAPFQFTTEPPLTKFVPFTISVKLVGLQLATVAVCIVDPGNTAASDVIVGVGGWVTVNVAAAGAGFVNVVPPPGAGVTTTTWAVVPAVSRSDAGMVAFSCVALTYCVGSVVVPFALLTHCTTEQGR